MHTSPLAQPGSGDGGGMNVYVRELSSALALAGVDCDVYTRACEKAETGGDEPEQRAKAEAQVIGCSDAVLAATGEERAQLERLYSAPSERVEIVSPGVDHRTFSPGPRAASRAVLGLGDGPV